MLGQWLMPLHKPHTICTRMQEMEATWVHADGQAAAMQAEATHLCNSLHEPLTRFLALADTTSSSSTNPSTHQPMPATTSADEYAQTSRSVATSVVRSLAMSLAQILAALESMRSAEDSSAAGSLQGQQGVLSDADWGVGPGGMLVTHGSAEHATGAGWLLPLSSAAARNAAWALQPPQLQRMRTHVDALLCVAACMQHCLAAVADRGVHLDVGMGLEVSSTGVGGVLSGAEVSMLQAMTVAVSALHAQVRCLGKFDASPCMGWWEVGHASLRVMFGDVQASCACFWRK